VALEFLPYSGVRNLEAALRIVNACGAANAGVLPDALHVERSGGAPGDIEAVAAERVVFAQLCDAAPWHGPRTDEALMREARGGRLAPGTGTLPLFEFLDALPPGCEIEYEVNRADMMDRTPDEKARMAASDAERFMEAYAAHRATCARGRTA
jgi:sugar phosphate isomerase/epimerase